MYFQCEWKTVLILIRWHHQEPANLYLQGFLYLKKKKKKKKKTGKIPSWSRSTSGYEIYHQNDL